MLWRLPVVWAGNTSTIRSAIAVAGTHCYNHDLETASGCTSWISGCWAGPATSEVQWSVVCDSLTFVITHYYTLQYIITLTITTYYYVLYFYNVDISFLHTITLPIIMYYYKIIIMYYYMIITIITWLLHPYYILLCSLLLHYYCIIIAHYYIAYYCSLLHHY